jgi:hypothetical protein
MHTDGSSSSFMKMMHQAAVATGVKASLLTQMLSSFEGEGGVVGGVAARLGPGAAGTARWPAGRKRRGERGFLGWGIWERRGCGR